MKRSHTIKLYDVINLEGFFSILDSCKEKVMMENWLGDWVDIRKNYWMQQHMIWTLPIGRLSEIELCFDNRNDEQKIISWVEKQ